MRNKIKNKIKVISIIFISFLVIFSNCTPVLAGYINYNNDKVNVKEKQLLEKIKIIHSVFPSQIDEAALLATLSHRGTLTSYLNDSYDPNFNKDDYKTSVNSLTSTISQANTEATEADLLLAATIIMLDSSGWLLPGASYSDEKYKKALAGNKLVGNMTDNPITDLLGAGFNFMFCAGGATADALATPVQFGVALGQGQASNFIQNKTSRYITMSNTCSQGYIGGTYPTVKTLKDDERKQAIKDQYAEEIINLAKLFRGKNGDVCAISSSGAFSTWKQYDPEWGGISLGGGRSLSAIGCLITSVSMQMARSGTKIANLPNGYDKFNPGAFATTLNNNSGFSGGGNFNWTGHQGIADNWVMGNSVSTNITSTSELASTLSNELSTGAEGQYQKFIVLQLHHNKSRQHWVAVDTVTDNQVTIMDPGATGTTLDDNYSGWVVDSYRVMYATDVEFGKIGASTDSSLDYCETSGDIIIPEEFGNGGYTVTFYHNSDNSWNWARNSNQGKLYYDYWLTNGATYDNGIATYDNRYLIACTTTFGDVGDKVDFFLDDGTKIPTIIADIKNPSDAGYNEWGHNNGQNILEFEVSRSMFKQHGNPGSGNWFPEWGGKRVSSAKNLGSIW